MKRRSLAHLIFVVPAVWIALAVPASAEQAPTWGWKPEEVAHYKEFWKPKKPPAQTSWSVDVVGAPAAPTAPAAESKPAAQKTGEAKPATPAETPPAIKAYCQNIEDAALDVRFLHQKSELQRLEGELEKRTSALEAKRAEYQEWLQRRDDFINKTEGGVVALFAKIKPDAAAAQLAGIDEEAAAVLLLKLKPRSASAILDQMDGAKAARLVSIMIGAAQRPEKAPENVPTRQAPAGPEAGKEQAAQPQPAEKKL